MPLSDGLIHGITGFNEEEEYQSGAQKVALFITFRQLAKQAEGIGFFVAGKLNISIVETTFADYGIRYQDGISDYRI